MGYLEVVSDATSDPKGEKDLPPEFSRDDGPVSQPPSAAGLEDDSLEQQWGKVLTGKTRKAARKLRTKLPEGLRLDLGQLFPRLTGWRTRRTNQAHLDMLHQASRVLRDALMPDETVRLITMGTVNHWWEALFLGSRALRINRTLIVLTDVRIILIHTDRHFRPRSYANEIPIFSIKRIRGGLFGSMTIETRRRVFAFSQIQRADMKLFREAVENNPEAQGRFRYLCPACFRPSDRFVETCPHCDTTFLSPRAAGLRSLFLPGLGNFYLGLRGIAVAEFLFFLAASGLVGMLIYLSAQRGVPFPSRLFPLGLMVVVNGLDALATFAMARKGLYSRDGKLPTKSTSPIAPLTPSPKSVLNGQLPQ
jgi:hypothetical protein